MVKYSINYENSYKNNFRTDVRGAVKFYLEDIEQSTENFEGFILYPQALNPFLKIMESLRESRNILILPAFDNDELDNINKPAYLILKIRGEANFIYEFLMTNK